MCTGCKVMSSRQRVQNFERGWMESPHHRENILRHGITEFGFGMAGSEGRSVVAVQAFAGPGTPRGTKSRKETRELSPAEQVERLAALIAAVRRDAGIAALQSGDGLSDVARRLVSNESDAIIDVDALADLHALLPVADRERYGDIEVMAARCGGCGVNPTAADVDYFAKYWLDQDGQTVRSAPLTRVGFAMVPDGQGMKSAVLVLAAPR
jgi:hypothetical protein